MMKPLRLQQFCTAKWPALLAIFVLLFQSLVPLAQAVVLSGSDADVDPNGAGYFTTISISVAIWS